MKLAITTSALLLGALTASTQAQTFTKAPQATRPAGKMVAPPAGTFFGGGDDCAAPDAIAGAGVFGYNTTAATTGSQGQAESNCYAFGTSGVATDVWFNWTSTFSGTARMTTCAGGSGDTKIAAYPGSACPTDGTSLACNDDTCGLLSEIDFPVTNGSSYMLQVGTFPGGTTSAGTFEVMDLGGGGCGGAGGGDDCASPSVIAGQGNFCYNTLAATTGSQGQNESNCYDFGTSGVSTDVWYTWTADVTGTATMTFCAGGAGDTKIAAYPGAGCPADGTSLACNDDTCGLLSEISFAVSAGSAYTLQVGTFPGGTTSSGDFDISIAGSPNLGTNYCIASGNSVSASGSNMSATGSASVSAQNLTLNADNAPSQPAIFYFGPNQLQIAFGNGFRCVGGFVVRLPVIGGSGGNFTYAVDFNSVTIPTGTQNFQCWYRDPAGGGSFFNLSDGYSIVMVP